MSKYKVLTDGNSSGLIQVVGLGVYVPIEKFLTAEAERNALAAQADSLLDNCKAFVKKEFELLKEVERLEIELKKRDEQNAALAAQVEALRDTCSYWINQAKPAGDCSKSEYSAWLALGYQSNAMTKPAQQHLRDVRAEAVASVTIDAYDAVCLNDFGGGNVGWWQDYIRSELGAAHDFYQSQIDNYAERVKAGER